MQPVPEAVGLGTRRDLNSQPPQATGDPWGGLSVGEL